MAESRLIRQKSEDVPKAKPSLSSLRAKSEDIPRSKSAANRIQNLRFRRQERLKRQDSIGAIEELVQCGICLEKLCDSRMLPCQHTFCFSCLQSHIIAQKLLTKTQTEEQNVILKCPVCLKKVTLEKGVESLKDLPKNLYIDSVLKLIDRDVSVETKPVESRCVKCHTFSQEEQQCCQHCMQVFCNICWNEHLQELESNLSILVEQVEGSQVKLDHKLENFESRCLQLIESIKEATLSKIELIRMDEVRILKEVESYLTEGRASHKNISEKIEEIRKKLAPKTFGNSPGKVFSFMNLHRETSRLLSLVNHYGEIRVIFDADSFKLDQDTEGVYNEVLDDNTTIVATTSNTTTDRWEIVAKMYKTRSYVPKLVWKRCPRPANIAVAPWDSRLFYIAATDTHSVLILNRDRKKIEERLTSPEMLYPQSVAFSKMHQEIYVSDKWKHCIHVFSRNGEYLRDLLGKGKVRSPDGIAMGPNEELVICDSGNDRVIIINPLTGEHLSTIGIVKNKTMLNMPTGVAISGDRIIVADTGNHRIKIFAMDGRKLLEFGSLGREKGQFRSAEVVAVDSSGFIFVGDGGNARVQIFQPDGTLVKIFGGSLHQSDDGFRWVSGILVTKEMDIVIADSKNKCLKIF